MPGLSGREVMGQMLRTNAELVASVLHGAGGAGEDPVLAAITATRNLGLLVDDTLHALVQQARAEGHTWAEIGALLHVTRQAAFARFGTDGGAGRFDPAGGAGSAAIAHAAERARTAIDAFLGGQLQALRASFDPVARAWSSEDLLQSARANVDRERGALRSAGEPAVTAWHGYTVVEVPLTFERGELLGRVVFDADGRVAGLWFLPAGDD